MPFMIRAARMCVVLACLGSGGAVRSEEPERVPFTVQAEPVFQELTPSYCWFHPRVAAIPALGKEGQPAVVMTIQKHLTADDHYSGLYFLRSDDLGRTWTAPTEIPELAWQAGENGETIAVCDVTPGWHHPSGRLIAIGTKLRYSPAGAQLLDQPRSHECAYATYDPPSRKWSRWKILAMPRTDDKFFLTAPGCVQWLVNDDGTLLLPTYFKGPTGDDYSVTVLHCSFDGEELKYLRHGDELTLSGGRGLCEPSLVRFQGTHFLTLRNDAAAYVTTSSDGLHFRPIQKWTFDDGQDLGSYNTQAHWLVHRGLFLVYTRRGADNDHITRNRAPLFVAQVDPQKLQVLRQTEQLLLPERGVMLGNFGAATITADESWVTDAEFLLGGKAHPRGADGTTWLGRVRWSPANQAEVVQVRDAASLKAALSKLKDATILRLAEGQYPGGHAVQNVANLTVEAADPDRPPRFEGGSYAWHFSGCSGLTLRHLRVSGQSHNGINLDDGGPANQRTRTVTVEHLDIRDIGPNGNFDGLKCSGLQDLTIRDCRMEGWGGQAIDLVGCHDVVITQCRFTGKPGYSQASGVQCKGGSEGVTIEKCHFVNAGQRPINAGGSTGLAYFRPRGAKHEARRIVIRQNEISGSPCACAFTGVDGAEFNGNLILFPEKWIFRILQETTEEGFVPCRNVLIEGNAIVFRRSQVSVDVNIGPYTAPDTFQFVKNRWFAEDRPDRSQPQLPSQEKEGTYGRDPRSLK